MAATRVFYLSPSHHRLLVTPVKFSPALLLSRQPAPYSSSQSHSYSTSYPSSSSSSSPCPSPTTATTQIRRKSTVSVAVGDMSGADAPPAPDALDFTQVQVAFASRTTPELIRAWAVFKISSYPFLVKNSRTLLGLSRKLVGERLTTWGLKQTFFGHFCGGETAEEVYPLLKKLNASGIRSILDYAAEADVQTEAAHLGDHASSEEAGLDGNVAIFLSCINTASAEEGGFAAAKLTALAQPELLEKITTVLSSVETLFRNLANVGPEADLSELTTTPEQLNAGLKKLGVSLSQENLQALLQALDPTHQGSISFVAWVEALSLTELSKVFDEKVIPRLSAKEQTQLVNLMRRAHTVAQAAADKKVRLMIDAEQTYFQKTIDHVVLTLQKKYNREFPVIFNTYQGYLRDSGKRVSFDLFRARRDGFIFAAKTVRGAYMIQERARAEKMGYPDPIQPNLQATHNNYNQLVQIILKAPQQTELMIASHNEESVKLAIAFQRSLGTKKNQRLYFGQLYGMCDYVSYTLGKHGYEVYKYLPYGPVHEVLPYLIRRAEENSDFLGRAGKERTMLLNEIKRRLSPF